MRRVDRGRVLLSDGGGTTRTLPYTPCDLARRSLTLNDFGYTGQRLVRDAAGSGVKLAF